MNKEAVLFPMMLRLPALVTILLLTGTPACFADVGTREVLLHERAELHGQFVELTGDTSITASNMADSVAAALIALDGRIMLSYEQTIARQSAQQRRRAANDRALSVFALLCCFVALGSVMALWLAHARISREEGSGLFALYRQLFRDFILTVRPEAAESPALTRISPVVILGVFGMLVSIVVYLLSSLK